MLHKTWNSKGEMPYCFPRSSIKFQVHTVQNITDFDPNWAFPDYRPVAAFKSLRFALFYILTEIGLGNPLAFSLSSSCWNNSPEIQDLGIWQSTSCWFVPHTQVWLMIDSDGDACCRRCDHPAAKMCILNVSIIYCQGPRFLSWLRSDSLCCSK